MNIDFPHRTSKKKIELFLISFCFVLFFVRTTIPVLKYPFLIIFLISVLYLLKEKGFRLFHDFRISYSFPVTLILLFLYLLVSALFSDKIYLLVIKDIINIIILFTIMIMMQAFAEDRNDLKKLQSQFLFLITAFALIISVQRIYVYFYASSYQSSILNSIAEEVDSNFALLPVFFGVTACIFYLIDENKRGKVFMFNLFLLIFSLNVLISGSRRGMVVFILFFLAIIIIHILGLLITNNRLKKIAKNTILYFSAFSVFLILIVVVALKTSVYFKNNLLESIGVVNRAYVKVQINQTLLKYSIFNRNDISDADFYSKIWHPVSDPKDPEAGTGNGNYQIVKTLTGKRVDIVPPGSKGYMIDKTCVGDSSLNHAYYFNLVNSTNVNSGDSVYASIYCYVSDNFNGTAVAFRATGALNGNSDVYYDLNDKGSWQKLNMKVNCKTGELRIQLYMNKSEVRNFSTLEGYVVFAYPEFRKSPGEMELGYSSPVSKKITYSFDALSFQKFDATTNTKYYNVFNVSDAELVSFYNVGNVLSYNSFRFSDPIRKWIVKIVSEDTIYHGYNARINIPKTLDKFGDDRVSRWKFALEIYFKEYSLSKKIFGGGFNFLNWYGYFFLNDKTKTDYPHNPILHILLYSGILGLALYLLLLYQVIFYYLKYRNEYPLFFIFFIITYYFTFFSGGNPFDPPVIGLFIILPFVLHSVNRRQNPRI